MSFQGTYSHKTKIEVSAQSVDCLLRKRVASSITATVHHISPGTERTVKARRSPIPLCPFHLLINPLHPDRLLPSTSNQKKKPDRNLAHLGNVPSKTILFTSGKLSCHPIGTLAHPPPLNVIAIILGKRAWRRPPSSQCNTLPINFVPLRTCQHRSSCRRRQARTYSLHG